MQFILSSCYFVMSTMYYAFFFISHTHVQVKFFKSELLNKNELPFHDTYMQVLLEIYNPILFIVYSEPKSAFKKHEPYIIYIECSDVSLSRLNYIQTPYNILYRFGTGTAGRYILYGSIQYALCVRTKSFRNAFCHVQRLIGKTRINDYRTVHS